MVFGCFGFNLDTITCVYNGYFGPLKFTTHSQESLHYNGF